ncbi:unnamed protein product [Rhizophagus irregularis]|nr:unnamed protein product [Rhizophagus irregularis]
MFSQNIPLIGDNILECLETNFINWTSGNEKINSFIQERQLKIDNYNDIVLEWIPYNQFSKIKETGKNEFITVYSAIWEAGPLYKVYNWSNYTRDSNKEVSLKCLHNLQESIDSLINEAKKYPTKFNAFQVLYGISQNPDTGDYILVLTCSSGNEKIDGFIQERQLKIDNYDDTVLEWIPYNQFNEIKEIGKNKIITVYTAIWKAGPLYKEYSWYNYTRYSNKEVSLKCLHNLQESIDSLINEAKKYPTKFNAFQVLYGISQNPDTGDYILVLTCSSGNEKIDGFIQERQLKSDNYDDIVLEWIPYNQFNEIKETERNELMTIYSAIWEIGPLYKEYDWCNYTRDSNKAVSLKCLHNLQESIDSLINEAKKYSTNYKAFQVLYGISQSPDTGSYILVVTCSSGNEKIDGFIQERQLKIDNYDDIVLEWIPYNQFNEIEEIGYNEFITVYSAIWEAGPLYKSYSWCNYTRDSNKAVSLKCLHNLQESIDSLINEAKKYPTKFNEFQVLYGISQNPDTGDYILVLTCSSGNEKIDGFIQERQLKIDNYDDIVLEWIPYNQFNKIKEIGKNELITIYSAIWEIGPLYKSYNWCNYTRDSNKEVSLRCLHNLQESIDSLINEAKKYPTKFNAFQVLYGISQDPDTGDYILVLTCSSGNEKIDSFIQEGQLKIDNYDDIVLEWIPYNQFNKIKEIGKNELITIYSAIWEIGPLYKSYNWCNYTRDSNKEVSLRCLHNLQESIDSLINEAKKYPTKFNAFQVLYGISQDPDTGDYILVLTCSSGNEKIDGFIQERQLKINNYDDIVLEWIPYNHFNEIKETGKNELITIYSAIWEIGPLYKSYNWCNYTRDSNKEVSLRCLHNLQESIDSLINEAKKYPTKFNAFQVLYGISQDPDTGDYILVLTCSSGNEKIDGFIQERQLKINNYDDIVLEWIPYNHFNEIKETGKNELITIYSAIWEIGPLYKSYNWCNYTRDSNKEVSLRCLHNLQESIDSLINEAKKYPTKFNAFQVLYGISQDPDTGDYILVLTCSSGNEKIDGFIRERQLKINNYDDIVLEWIPYNQFNEIKETGRNELMTIYSAIWGIGPLYKSYSWRNYTRDSNKEVSLRCLHNLQESIDSLINEAKKYPTKFNAFQVLYGISQDPDTGDYILVLTCSSGNEKIDGFIRERQLKINNYDDIVLEWIPYNQFNEIKEIGKNELITIYSAIWGIGPLYKSYSWCNYTRDSNKEVSLRCLHNLQESIDSLINEAKKYPTKFNAFQVFYGISQDPDTGNYILVLTCSSGNEKIDSFIQERQLKINNYDDIVLEWIPYNQFNEIKETGKNEFMTVYSAIWKAGPLYKEYSLSNYVRDSNKAVTLKCCHNLQESIDSLIFEAKKYSTNYNSFQVLYGISQNSDTGNYILVLTCSSGNEKIDGFIQERQLKINKYDDIVLEWIPYNHFNEIKETGKNELITVYSAIWKAGPLYKEYSLSNYTRDSNKAVTLKCLHNLQESIDSLINEAKKYLINYNSFQVLYGISQDLDTGDYILVLTCSSGNEIIDGFIQERQLKINNYYDIVLEWIPYNQFNEIKGTGKNESITVYSAIWKAGPLYKEYSWSNYTRYSNMEVSLKCLHNLQESIDSLINEAKKYSTSYEAFQVLYGISQSPDTGNYILVVTCLSGNEKIDGFIQERQLKIDNYNDIVLEWIPYNQFNEIKETEKNEFITVYSAIWKAGPLYKENSLSNYTRDSNKEVSLKCLHNLQVSIDSLINEAKKYSTNYNSFQVLYGISQNPDTGYYILVLTCSSGNEKIDDSIQERQLKIDNYNDMVL